jgi:hypothetical protein
VLEWLLEKEYDKIKLSSVGKNVKPLHTFGKGVRR